MQATEGNREVTAEAFAPEPRDHGYISWLDRLKRTSIECRALGDHLLDHIGLMDYERGPWAPFFQFWLFCDLAGRQKYDLQNKTCIDFGCGNLRPYSIASLLYMLGAKQVLCVDTAPLSDEADVALGLYSLLLSVLTRGTNAPIDKVHGSELEMRRRVAEFDMRRLYAGDLGGVPTALSFRQGDYRLLSQHERSFDLLISGSVLEHVADLSGYFAAFRENIASDGLIFSVIDLRDHRHFHGDSAWQFMIDGSDLASRFFINKLRYSEILKMIRRHGFLLVEEDNIIEVPTSEERKLFLPEFREMSELDITTMEMRIVLRPI
jgi:SAM-dependent methyltransferase